MNENRKPLIQAQNLKKYFKISKESYLHAVDDVSFDVYPGETLGLVGESGCGKSTIGYIVSRLLDSTGGKLIYNGTDILGLEGKANMEFRKNVQIIFQDPYSSLNPKKRIRNILTEGYRIRHMAKDHKELDRLLKELCERTGISEDLWDCFPHELDGGKRQIVGIARALSLNPDFIVCDEPVSSLDVSVQAKVINLLMDLQKELELSYLFISHDLSVVRHISNRIAVMYLGKIVEMAESEEIFSNTLHPYSLGLLSAVPRVDVNSRSSRLVLKGDVPSPIDPKPGCRFASRCWMAREKCFDDIPELAEVRPGHSVACHYHGESKKLVKLAETVSISSSSISAVV